MIAWLLVEVTESDAQERLRSASLANALQLVVGSVGNEVILHVQSTTLEDLNAALGTFASLAGVTSVSTLRVRPA